MSDSSFLSLLDNVALNLRRNRTVSSKNELIRKCVVVVRFVLLIIVKYRSEDKRSVSW